MKNLLSFFSLILIFKKYRQNESVCTKQLRQLPKKFDEFLKQNSISKTNSKEAYFACQAIFGHHLGPKKFSKLILILTVNMKCSGNDTNLVVFIVQEVDEDDDGAISFREFMLIFRKAAAGELHEDSGLGMLARQCEINVEEVGVGGAKDFFEAKVNIIFH